MIFDQPAQPRVQDIGERQLSGQQLALARRDAEAEQQCRAPGQCAGKPRFEQTRETGQRLSPLRIGDIAAKQRGKIDAVEASQDMREPDETAERAMSVDPSQK